MFQVGDKVALFYGSNAVKITEVVKVTPTGRVRIKGNNSQFRPDGSEMSKDPWRINRYYIEPLTTELYNKIKTERTILHAFRLCREVKESNLTFEKAQKLIELLGKKNEDKE